MGVSLCDKCNTKVMMHYVQGQVINYIVTASLLCLLNYMLYGKLDIHQLGHSSILWLVLCCKELKLLLNHHVRKPHWK